MGTQMASSKTKKKNRSRKTTMSPTDVQRRSRTIEASGMIATKLDYLDCLSDFNQVICSPVVFYPLPRERCLFVLHIAQRSDASVLLPSVTAALEDIKAIRGTQRMQCGANTLLLDNALPGTYLLSSVVTGAACAEVVICEYEPHHAGHKGRFASGYSYFLCGLLRPAIAYEVRVRKVGHGTNFTISRSYSGDCEDPNHVSKGHGHAEPMIASTPPPTDPTTLPIAGSLTRSTVNTTSGSQTPSCTICAVEQRSSLLAHFSQTFKQYVLEPRRFTNDVRFVKTVRRCGNCEGGRALEKNTTSLREPPGSRSRQRQNGTSASSAAGSTNNYKYFAQRHRLITKFNSDLQLSEQAWFSICPEEIARHIGSRLWKLQQTLGRPVRVLEPFCGAGGNAVSCARMPHVDHVYAFDIERRETETAAELAILYNVTKKITIGVKDVLTLSPQDLPKSVDAVVFSPPWGGPEYQNAAVYDLAAIQTPAPYGELLRHFSRFSKNMAVLMPRTSALDQYVKSASSAGFARVELERNVLGGRVKMVTVYYGELAN